MSEIPTTKGGSMAFPAATLCVELVPHCTSVPRDGWTGSHDVRPLAELGHRQAAALVSAIGTDIGGIYSSPATRCRQTVEPLAAAAGLPVRDLPDLYEAGDFGEPAAGTEVMPDVMVPAIGGAWAAGRMLRAVLVMAGAHPGGRVVAASHGDVIPVMLAALSSFYGVPRPRHVGRGGWYSVLFGPDDLAVTAHDPVKL
jgi:8-oxo-dGTP diphosphatase